MVVLFMTYSYAAEDLIQLILALAYDGSCHSWNLMAFLPKPTLKLCFLKKKFSRRPYSRPIESPVKVSSSLYAWLGSLLQTDRHT